jgi:hypothetical protein
VYVSLFFGFAGNGTHKLMQDQLTFSIVKVVPDRIPRTSPGKNIRDVPPELLVEMFANLNFKELATSVFIAEHTLAKKLGGCMPFKTVELEPRIDALVATRLTAAGLVSKIKALTFLDEKDLKRFKKHFLREVLSAKNVETISLGSVQLLRNLDLRDHHRLAVLDLDVVKFDASMLKVLKSVKAPENLRTLIIRSEYFYSALPTLNLVKTLLDAFAGLENLRTTIIYKPVHWGNLGGGALARLKHLAVAIPTRLVLLPFDKFTNLVGLELTFTDCEMPLTRSIMEALQTFNMPSLEVLVLKRLYTFRCLSSLITFLASTSRACPRLKILDVVTLYNRQNFELSRLVADDMRWPFVTTGLEQLDFLSISHDSCDADWSDIELLLEAFIPHLEAFYLEVGSSGTYRADFGPHSRNAVNRVLRNLREGYRGDFRVLDNDEPVGTTCCAVLFAISAAFEDPRAYFFRDYPFFNA